MTPAGLALVLAAAVCHAAWNVLVKRLAAGAELIWLFSLVTVIVYLPFAAWVFVSEAPDLGLLQGVFLVGSMVLHLAYFSLLQAGYRAGDLSLVYPVARATGPLLSTTFAVLLLGENVTPQMLAGALLIVLGVLMLSGGLRRGAHNVTASLVFGLVVGALIGSYTAWDAYAVSVLLVPPLLLDYASNVGRVVVLAPVAMARRDKVRALWRDHRSSVIGIGVLSPLAYILVLYALTFTPVAYVAPTREVSVLLAVLAGSILLREGHLKRRLGWAAVILAGMATLVTG